MNKICTMFRFTYETLLHVLCCGIINNSVHLFVNKTKNCLDGNEIPSRCEGMYNDRILKHEINRNLQFSLKRNMNKSENNFWKE
jgi:hypothetical protein